MSMSASSYGAVVQRVPGDAVRQDRVEFLLRVRSGLFEGAA
ncbi:hypothetical protein [Micromonospora sp. NPDC005413]